MAVSRWPVDPTSLDKDSNEESEIKCKQKQIQKELLPKANDWHMLSDLTLCIQRNITECKFILVFLVFKYDNPPGGGGAWL